MRFTSLFFTALLAGSGVAHDAKDVDAPTSVNCKWEGNAPGCFPTPCPGMKNARPYDLQWSNFGGERTKGYRRCRCSDESEKYPSLS
ncbi:hypothetical protein BDW42DRAFT_194312 [Aspergillus taichungensis]|uniref:Uncharacterized protein n=1 Tax=Aspergillus taichungensis TaxID=482145 RepID=A0A2J5HTZ5_9EURO|nr:hypothetical protein BDW42DRAFT_194312 [Aspergillus taichungensis]